MDAVLLSGFVKAKKNQRILDLGTGTGIIPVLLAAKTCAKEIIGLEIQPSIAEMAKRSVRGNGLDDRVMILEGDIRSVSGILGAGSFDVVTSNPPYTKAGSGHVNPAESKAIARHEIYCTLKDVLVNGALMLMPQGEFYMVHRPDRLTDVLEGMRKVKLEPKVLRMVCPRAGDAPSLFLVRAMKNGNPGGLVIMPDLVIYDQNGMYTEEACIQYTIN
jgi:tRNA1Val (adenine37-N6)-methyltransferase